MSTKTLLSRGNRDDQDIYKRQNEKKIIIQYDKYCNTDMNKMKA